MWQAIFSSGDFPMSTTLQSVRRLAMLYWQPWLHPQHTHRKQLGHVAQLVGLQAVDEGVLLAERVLKQLLVLPPQLAEALAQKAIVPAATWYIT